MHTSMIDNLDLEELERHTQQLLDEGDCGPDTAATLRRWMDVNADETGELEQQIEHLKRKIDKTKGLAQYE